MRTSHPRRVAALTAIGTAALLLSACGPGVTGGSADGEFPSKRIEIVVPYGAGGATDTHARAVADGMAGELGVDVQVVNKPGSAGAIGTSETAQAGADGYELLFAAASSFTAVPNLQEISYSEDDFTGVAMMFEQGYGLVVHEDDFTDLADLASQDGRVTYAYTGTGNPTHLASEDFAAEAGLEAEGVPFDAATDAIQAVRGGQVDFAIADLNIAGSQVSQDEELAALAVTTEERQEQLPDVPTFHEEGYLGEEVYASRFALAAPAGTPEETVGVLRGAVETVLGSDSFSEFAASNYLYPSPHTDAEEWFTTWIPEERELVAGKFDEFGIGAE
ncbi:tripartite tricarboxylate transporter substrate binding protein [Brevibacterium album]|uniref:tripartite tricarboxylate transporter substrate binding protein n=1 Tax=Brevibacterium album TaxID=417948 RepID=UPI00040D8ABD|nr:tripartite tricarboxylate transporter substrate binding protein [Brevibacterium album]